VSDYTHDDAMRDLEVLRDCTWDYRCADGCCDERVQRHPEETENLAAHIERLEAEAARVPALHAAYQNLVDANERLEAENADILWRRNWLADRLKATQADRDEWEAVARWLASHEVYGGTAARIKQAQEAVRHE